MSTIELRNNIIEELGRINDKSFLEAIKTIIDTKLKNEVCQLTHNQLTKLHESRTQIKNGQFIENKELEIEVEKWLSSK